MAYNAVNVVGPGPSNGSGYRIGDGYVLTAGHVVYEFNSSTSTVITNKSVIEYRPYALSYLTEALDRLAIIAGGGVADMAPEAIEGAASVHVNDSVIIEESGNVDDDDQGLIVFLSNSDLQASEALFGSGTQIRMVSDSHDRAADIISVQSKVFRANDVVVGGDSGGAFLFETEGKGFVIGTVSGHLPGSYSVATHFSYDEWRSINAIIGSGLTGNVTLNEPTNMIVGTSSGDSGIEGSYRADIILGRDGGDVISDGDLLGDSVWANDRLFGGAGDDALFAGNGNDLVHGGDYRGYSGAARISIESDGDDLIYYSGGRTAVDKGLEVRLVPSSSTDAAVWEFGNDVDKIHAAYVFDMLTGSRNSFGNDTLISVEQIWLSSADDVVRIDALDSNVLAGQDELGGIAKIDMAGQGIASGAGDLIDASRYVGSIKIDLDGSNFNVHAVGDTSLGLTVLNAEHANGGVGNDELIGNFGDNHLSGGAGNDELKGGAGADRLLGGIGDDIFFGGEGSDEIRGGDGGSYQGILDGNDKAYYSDNDESIKIVYSNTSIEPSVAVYRGSDTDYLHSIEEIIGSVGNDYVEIVGQISLDTDLTIDANGGQVGGVSASMINGSAVDGELTFNVDENGDGYVSTANGGKIKLKGFHTQIIGSSQDDELTDNSQGDKKIDGGEGNDTISTAGSTGNATIYGGNGDDTITGGSGNDIIFGDFSYVWDNYTNVLSGGAGNDLIISTSENDTIDGGDDADHIRILFADTIPGWNISNEITVEGGEGDDVIEVAAGLGSINVIFNDGDGHDTLQVKTPENMGSYWSATDLHIQMGGVTSASDFTIIVDATPGASGDYRGLADLALVNNITGDSIYLPSQFVNVVEAGEGNISNFSHITVNDMWDGEYIYQYGSVASFVTDLTEFNNATEPDAGDTNGSPGDDTLSGGPGDDTLSGGDGNDIFEASGGNDTIIGGAGNDTLNLFGSRTQFTVTGDSSSMTLTDVFGREGQITATGIERVFFVGDGDVYNVGDFFGYYGTSADDEIVASNRDNEIFGLDGNDSLEALGGDDVIEGGAGDDAIDGGDGIDTANYAGSSTDYVVTRLASGAVIETIGVGLDDGTDTLHGVEFLYFADDNVTLDLSTLPLEGTSGEDILIGGNGDDLIAGGDGDDLLEGGAGYDVLDGGSGNDTAYYTGNSNDYSIYLGTDGGVYIDDYSESGAEGSDELIDIEVLYFAGDDKTVLISADLPPLGTSGNDVIQGTTRHDSLFGLEGDDVLTGGAGHDYLNGGEGADTMTGGEGDDYYIVDDANDVVSENTDEGYDSVESSISYTLGANLEDLWLWNDSLAIDGTGNSLDNGIWGDEFGNVLMGLDGDDSLDGGGGDDIIDGGNGTDTANYFGLADDFETFRNLDGSVTVIDLVGSAGEDTLFNIEHLNFSYWENVMVDVADLPLRGTASNDVLNGAAGDDTLFGLEGNDRLTGGAGNDIVDGGLGLDTAVFSGTQATHTIATNAGVVTITDNQPSTDGNDGTDTVIGIEIAEFKGGVQVGITSPIVLDLNGDGVTLVNNRDSNVAFDWDNDGRRNQTGWVGRDDGFLVIDRNGDGLVSNASELSFTGDKPGAKSDLDGLRAFDSNGDGEFSSSDEEFDRFKIWRDANGNGRSEANEMLSLADAGIASIDLSGEAVNRTWAWGDNMVINTGSFTRNDGSAGAFGDVALNYDPLSQRNVRPFLPNWHMQKRFRTSLDIDRAAARFGEAIVGFVGRGGDLAELQFDDGALAPRDIHFAPVRDLVMM